MELLTTLLWILVALFVGPTFYYGYVKMIAETGKMRKFASWGYSIKILQAIGVIEIIGAIAVLFPDLRLFGIAIWTVILTGAVFTNIIHHESRKEIWAVVKVLVHLMIILALNVWINISIR